MLMPIGGVNFPYTITLYGTTNPVGGTFTLVNWGDGTTTNNPNLVAGSTHAYAAAGTYTITAYWSAPGVNPTPCTKTIKLTKKTLPI